MDIDGVIRDVSDSYRQAILSTVYHFSGRSLTPDAIDELKLEGRWNNDWDVALELLRRLDRSQPLKGGVPSRTAVVKFFSDTYFGGDPEDDPRSWNGLIKYESLLVPASLFRELSRHNIAWGFVSGAELASARFVLEYRLGLKQPALVAMGDAPEKPDPTGLLMLARRLAGQPLGVGAPPLAYLGDTVADVETLQRARQQYPDQLLLSIAVAPPHLHNLGREQQRYQYEKQLRCAGADVVLMKTTHVVSTLFTWLDSQSQDIFPA